MVREEHRRRQVPVVQATTGQSQGRYRLPTGSSKMTEFAFVVGLIAGGAIRHFFPAIFHSRSIDEAESVFMAADRGESFESRAKRASEGS